ncbi:hypothetical protein JM83_1271 [Gillisia sp. Hel_I_86]|uniref:hypothetical protein n=1 Tax=Gillisia sp. Hel_I_86 TaxID=1249981 RepID=UPI00119B9CB4|nr:hypothetical protein [Gillisia sp. Hel_I_86]TVZ26316.1 hypothetical protein JM83_1271 [Gillisia sp. Hel_I_86]
MKLILISFFLLLFTSCIPVRIAPEIKEDKVMVAKKFKRKLPKKYSYIFVDPKDADEFYNYINTKYQLDHDNVGYNVPVLINKKEYFLSFHEVEIPTKTINLVPLFIDAGLKSKDYDPLFEGSHITRIGNWYLVLTIADSELNDCLDPSATNRKQVLKFLKETRLEYLATTNYFDALFRK